jgi:hypothetical protein
MAQQKQTITLLSCCQSTLGHASKQPNTCADVEVVEWMSNRTHKYITIEFTNFDESKPCRNCDIAISGWHSEEPRACAACNLRLCPISGNRTPAKDGAKTATNRAAAVHVLTTRQCTAVLSTTLHGRTSSASDKCVVTICWVP